MDYPSAMTFEINTPFMLPGELFKGFIVTRKAVSYIRTGLGIIMNHPTKDVPERFTMYNDYLNSITPKMDVKVLSIKPMWVFSEVYMEHIEFEITLNRYSITPTKALTYELFHNFVKNINDELSPIKNHPLKDFFVRTGVKNINNFYRYGIQIATDNSFISLPDVYIPVTDTEISEKRITEMIQYMDSLKNYYQQCYNEFTEEEDESGYITIPVCNDDEQVVHAPGWSDSSEDEPLIEVPVWGDSEEENA